MPEVEWMSSTFRFLSLFLEILQAYAATQKELNKVQGELTALKTKLARLEEDYGYDTVN